MAIIKCPECGHQINETATVCPSCGEKIAGNIVKCLYCGEVYFKDDGICPRCYRPLPHDDFASDETPSSVDTSVDNDNSPLENLPESSTAHGEIQQESGKDELGLESEPIDEKFDESESDDADEPLASEDDEITKQLPKDKDTDSKSMLEGDDVEEESYIDTDDENLAKPVHEDEGKAEEEKGKLKYIPVVVSLAIAALIAAVSLYFYNASKLDDETRAYDIAIGSNDIKEMQNFLLKFPDATSKHKEAIQGKIEYINKHKDDLSFIMMTRNKDNILQFLNNFPDTPKKQTLLAMVDSIDWEDAMKLNTKEAYEHYLEAHATGLFAKEAKDKLAVKILAANAEDEARAKSLFREFFLSVNGNESSRLEATLSPQLSSFMGTSNPSSGDVVAWMNRQHKEDISNVIWKLNHDYKITKREQNDIKVSTVDFTAKQTINYKDGRTSNEHYKVTATVTNNKISSMSMTKYVPKPTEQTSSGNSTTGSSKPSTNNSSSNSQNNKPSGNGTSTSKPSGSSTPSKPANTQSKPSGTPSKPTQSKPTNTQSKPTQSKPTNTQNKPAKSKPTNTQSKPTQSKPTNTQSKPTRSKPTNTQSKPTQSKPSGTQSKPGNGAKK
ncbi:MAG: zinc-ribbon domain-containing protein [Prevotella sp.]|nr:zinc-ribbon domain-containing protein [Prevotella sp.]